MCVPEVAQERGGHDDYRLWAFFQRQRTTSTAGAMATLGRCWDQSVRGGRKASVGN